MTYILVNWTYLQREKRFYTIWKDSLKIDSAFDMNRYFHTDNNFILLFENWKSSSWTDLILFGLFVSILALVGEGLKTCRELSLENAQEGEQKKPGEKRGCTWTHLIQTVCHIVQVFIMNILMLALMTYNLWIALSIVIGSGVGYFTYGWINVHVTRQPRKPTMCAVPVDTEESDSAPGNAASSSHLGQEVHSENRNENRNNDREEHSEQEFLYTLDELCRETAV